MTAPVAEQILECLQHVAEQRRLRKVSAGLEHAVEALKQYQQSRFKRSYADLLASPRYQHAAQFFLEELYGPGDFTRRDAQFARVVPGLARLFPTEVLQTVAHLAELHAISERLDTDMARHLEGQPPCAASYARAWQLTGMPERRQAQIDLTMAVGQALDGYTRKPLLRQALRMMRGPAQAAGLSELQQFLELGFDTFKAMKGAQEFLATVRHREEALASALFSCKASELPRPCLASDDPLGHLP